MTMRVEAAKLGDAADIAVSYAGWTLTVDHAGIDNLFDDTMAQQDVKLSGYYCWLVCSSDIR
jgi:hypothetical protein